MKRIIKNIFTLLDISFPAICAILACFAFIESEEIMGGLWMIISILAGIERQGREEV
jgi:hypothetical protein